MLGMLPSYRNPPLRKSQLACKLIQLKTKQYNKTPILSEVAQFPKDLICPFICVSNLSLHVLNLGSCGIHEIEMNH